MNSLYKHLFGFLQNYTLTTQHSANIMYLPVQSLPFSYTYTGKSMIYIGAALFILSIITLFITFHERRKSNRALREEERFLSDIFMKITHELRTPLTVILGLSKHLRDHKNLSNGNLSTYLSAIERQGKSISELVNQLLDIAHLQTSNKTIEWKTGNIVAFIEMISESLRIYAAQKNIELTFFCKEAVIETDFVPDYLHKILHNLLNNAIKFSEEGSRIQLIVEKSKEQPKKIVIQVIDYGIGIKKEVLPHIFDLFYKDSINNGEISSSSGIGLALVKQLTESLGGRIDVKSEYGKGSTFWVELPIQKDLRQIYSHWIPNTTTFNNREEPSVYNERTDTEEIPPQSNVLTTSILLAEDNKDVALFIQSLFPQELYHIIYARNGEKAWEIVNKQIPDIVITDVLMPHKSGIELCKEIKESPLLNHIPVILISAKSRESDLLEGLKSGADCYIRKPFYPEELLVHVENLVETRHILKEKYNRTVKKGEEVRLNNIDNKSTDFIRRVTDIIYREMKNPDFTPGRLAQELAISVSQLNKKLNAITGYPSSGYILQIKIYHAKKILNTQDKTIGEVAAECGIFDMNYFSRVFKKHTGMSPSQFKRLSPMETTEKSL